MRETCVHAGTGCELAARDMMLWRRQRCPVSDRVRRWVDDQFTWLIGQFGDRFLQTPVVVPTAAFFPGEYSGTPEDIDGLVSRMCIHVGVNARDVVVDIFETPQERARRDLPFLSGSGVSVAGDWRQEDGKTRIGLDRAQLRFPRAVVAVIAHELAHQRLLGEQRVEPTRRDGEQLTDLTTVFFGLGIFTANAALEFAARHSGGWSATKLGYLDERMFGYALARYATARNEPEPSWAEYLDLNPRTYMRHGIGFLQRQQDPDH